jgi:hypothetical protein
MDGFEARLIYVSGRSRSGQQGAGRAALCFLAGIASHHPIWDNYSHTRCFSPNKCSIWEDHRFTRAREPLNNELAEKQFYRGDAMFNEGKACDAVIRHIEARENSQRKDLKHPEMDKKNIPHNKHVELTFKVGELFFAIEHTGIEPFPGQIESSVYSHKLFSPIIERVAGKLPNTEFFKLCVPSKIDTLKPSQIASIQEILVNWIEEIAPTLPISDYRIATPIEEVREPEVPFKVMLYRYNITPINLTRLGGRLQLCNIVDDVFIEAERKKRIYTACNKKYPKLFEWKKEDHARTILVLEENDINLTNHQLVINAFIDIDNKIPTKPDEVYLVSTCIDTTWWVTCIRINNKYYTELEFSERSWEVDPTTLVDVSND